MEAAELVAAGWLAAQWRATPWVARLSLVTLIAILSADDWESRERTSSWAT
jgi:hypothetical protein